MAARRRLTLSPFVFALSYGVFGAFYIVFSDRILTSLAGDYAHYQQLQTAKGWGFILFTALGLWLLLRRAWAQLSQAAEVAIKAEDQLRLALTAAGGLVWQARRMPGSGAIEWIVNGGLARQLGLPEGQWFNLDEVATHLHPADLPAFRSPFETTAERGPEAPEILVRFRTPDGTHRWIKVVPDGRSGAGTADDPMVGVAFDLTRQQEVSQDLAEVIFGAGLGTWRLEVATGCSRINDRYAQMLGYSRDELEPMTQAKFFSLVHPDDVGKLRVNAAQKGAGDYIFAEEIRMRHRSGHWVWILSRCRPVDYAADGAPSVISGVHVDISDRKALAELLQLERDFLKRLVETSISGIVALNDKGQIYFVNTEATAILGLPAEKLIGLSMRNDHWTVTELDGTPIAPENFPSARAMATQSIIRDRRVSIRHRDGRTQSISVTAAPMQMPDGRMQVVATFTDITAQLANEMLLRNAAAEATHYALHDPVTGLPNRELFEDVLSAAITTARRGGGQLMHVFLDIDNFKQVNDRFGHHAGDLLIRKVAERLEEIRQPPQVLARVAGDEFSFLHPCAPGEDTGSVLSRLASVFEPPFDLGGYAAHITVSMGVSVYPADAESSEGLWRNADLAMYEAKSRGRNQIVHFTASLRDRQAEEARVAQILQRALKAREFSIVLMPMVDLQDGNRIVGAEALLRSTDPELQEIGPAVFLPVAARTGLMRALDLMVVDMVGAATARLKAAGHALRISVNLSPESLQEMGFGLELLSRLDQAQLGPADLRFELTEGALVDLTSHAREVLDLLHGRGFELSADDFGTGYSSLSYLHQLRLSEVKIDRSFVQRLETAQDPSDEIVRAILAMGQALGLSVLAEGIETEAQRDWLCRHGCASGQGYLFGKGVDVDTLMQCHLTPQEVDML